MNRIFPLLCFGLLIGCFSCQQENNTASARVSKVIIGYAPGFRGALDVETIPAEKVSHINYAFVDVKDSMAWLTNIATDTINFRNLVKLREKNPDLKILISIGGWSWSENFSDAVLTPSSRRKFAETSVAIVEKYDLDGVDIDWEYPGFKGEDNVFRPEDRENFVLMFQALRHELDRLSEETGKILLLTTAVPCFSEFLERNDMGAAAQYLDYVNLMAYDFYVSGPFAGHHSNLYHSESYEAEQSAHRAVTEYVAQGVPVEKIVLGVPFYGRSWFMQTADNHGINRAIESVTRGGGYTFIRDSMMIRPGFVRHWDDKAKMPYLFNEETRQLVTYDDEESLRIKCDYVIENNLAGVMFWQFASDPKGYLLDALNEKIAP
ncbi:MAG: glycoside hydrolase family 18 protein [Cyclobacteriaceae bacterium]|nr:glycoside hydrolase family 18 protein [Cyclobacteriaceae bacterium]